MGSERSGPDYELCVRGAPLARDGGLDRSNADFVWCLMAAQRGHTIEDTPAKLLEVSAKAQENARRHDEGYARLTAEIQLRLRNEDVSGAGLKGFRHISNYTQFTNPRKSYGTKSLSDNKAEILAAVDMAEVSIGRGEGRAITQESMRQLAGEVKQRGLARLIAETYPSR